MEMYILSNLKNKVIHIVYRKDVLAIHIFSCDLLDTTILNTNPPPPHFPVGHVHACDSGMRQGAGLKHLLE